MWLRWQTCERHRQGKQQFLISFLLWIITIIKWPKLICFVFPLVAIIMMSHLHICLYLLFLIANKRCLKYWNSIKLIYYYSSCCDVADLCCYIKTIRVNVYGAAAYLIGIVITEQNHSAGSSFQVTTLILAAHWSCWNRDKQTVDTFLLIPLNHQAAAPGVRGHPPRLGGWCIKVCWRLLLSARWRHCVSVLEEAEALLLLCSPSSIKTLLLLNISLFIH